jgi:hypothetical protein
VDEVCTNCGSTLIPGRRDDLEARAGAFHMTYRGIPMLTCPRGCPGGHADPAMTVVGILKLARQVSSCVAKRKGIFSKRPVCRLCEGDLVESGVEHTWTLNAEASGAKSTELIMTGPALLCPRCQTYFIPSDQRSKELVQTVSGALSAPSDE